MIRRKFYLAVIARVVLIVAAALVMAFNIFRYEKLFTVLASGVVIVLAAWDLIRLTNLFNREILSFFEALKHEDHAFGLRKVNVPGFPVLSGYMDELRRKLSDVYVDQEIQARFLGSIVDHVQVGLLAAEPEGKVVLCNQAAQRLLAIHRIGHMNALRERFPEFGQQLTKMRAGDQKMIRILAGDCERQLSVRCGFFTSRRGRVYLYSFQDVAYEVEEAELETWKKLIRVLTHEINNSISPICSLSDSIRKKMKQMEETDVPEPEDPEKTRFSRINEGLQIIQERSNGLLEFVEKFRSLTPRGSLHRETFAVDELFYRVRILMQDKEKPVIESAVYPESLDLYADKKLVEQVLINLVKNGVEAKAEEEEEKKAEAKAEAEAKEEKKKAKAEAKAKEEEDKEKKEREEEREEGAKLRISMKAYKEGARRVIEVADNGPGIPREELSRIFIPFYTTRSQGSGVGLSLSRQIMRMHGGSISVRSTVGQGTTFRLVFGGLGD